MRLRSGCGIGNSLRRFTMSRAGGSSGRSTPGVREVIAVLRLVGG